MSKEKCDFFEGKYKEMLATDFSIRKILKKIK